jgi:porin
MVLSAFWPARAGAQETMPYDLSPASAFQPTTNTVQTDQTFGTGGLHETEVPRDLRPFQLLVPPEHLLGDWAGLRTELQRMGITPTLSLVTDVAANPTGGKSQGITEASNLGLNLLFDLDKIGGVKDATFLLQLSQRWGSSLSTDHIGNIFTTQQVYGGQTFRAVDAAYQQKFFDDHVEVRLGRIAAGDDFLVSPYDYLFMQNGFDGNPVGIFFDTHGMTAYPNAAWGALVKVCPTQRTYAMVGVYDGDPAIRANRFHGVNMDFDGPVYVMGEGGFQVNGLPGDTGLIGDYKAGFWYDNAAAIEFGTSHTRRGSYGAYGLFDQILVPFGERGSNRGLGVFSSATFSLDPSVAQLPYFFTGGVAARGILGSRPRDVCGFGVLYGLFSGQLDDAQEQALLHNPATLVQDHELVLEATYKFYFKGNSLFFQPDLQYIFHPGGSGRTADALVIGCQAGINF